MDLGLENRVALVIDAHLSVANAAAAALGVEGAVLALAAPDRKSLRQAERELTRHIPQERLRGVIANMEKEQDIRHLARETLHRQGEVSILITGGAGADPAGAAKMDPEQIEPALNRNFLSTVRLVREIIPHMKRFGEGRIINLLPRSAVAVTAHNVPAAASTAPVLAYFKGLAAELAPCKITVNTVIYDGVNLPEDQEARRQSAVGQLGLGAAAVLTEPAAADPAQRLAEPQEIGDVICMLASRQTAYLTGADIIIDGGRRHTAV